MSNTTLNFADLVENGSMMFVDVPNELKDSVYGILAERGLYEEDDNKYIYEEENVIIPRATVNNSSTYNLPIQVCYLTPNKYSRPQIKLKKVTKVAIHYVGGAGSKAINVRNYFNNLAKTKTAYASSHYIVGLQGEIIQCIPETEIAYCTNSANDYSISIENCHPHSDGKFNSATYNSLVSLVAGICTKYKLNPLKDIIRHYDVTGKSCPYYWIPRKHPEEYEKFKQDVYNKMYPKVEKIEEEIEVKKTINVKVDGTPMTTQGYFADNKNLFTADFLRTLGFNVGYDTNTKVVTIDHNVKPTTVVVNGETKEIPSLLIKGNNYAMLRSISEITGAFDVGYENGQIIINKRGDDND